MKNHPKNGFLQGIPDSDIHSSSCEESDYSNLSDSCQHLAIA